MTNEKRPAIETPVATIEVEGRTRSDMGDIDALAASIESLGLLQPIGIDANHKLVFGERRLRAFEKLGRETIPARIVHVGSILQAEHDENELRKDFTPSERVAIGKALEEEIGNRQGRRTDKLVENIPQVESGKKTREIAAERAGFGNETTYRQAKAVTEHGAPELIDAMDRGEVSVSAAATIARADPEEQREIVAKGRDEILDKAKEIRRKEREERKARNATLKAESPTRIEANGKYRVIVIDPPWDMQKIERDERPNQSAFDYPTMSEAELAAFGVEDVAADDCHLFCWATQKHMPTSLRLLEVWGFRYVCAFVWHKPGGYQPVGLPQYNCEFVIYGRKGSPGFVDTKRFFTCFEAPRRGHSRKPESFYETVSRVTEGPRIDVFAREPRKGFDLFGNEKDRFAA